MTSKTIRVTIATAVTALLGMAGSGAWASSPTPEVSSTITINGTVANSCKLGAWSHSGDGNFDPGTNTVSLDLDQDGDAQLDSGLSFDLSANAMCNYSAANGVQVQSGTPDGLHLAGVTPPAGFVNHVDYRATVDWAGINGGSISYTTDGAGQKTAQADLQPANATLTLTIDNLTAGGNLLAGTYTETVTVTIGTI